MAKLGYRPALDGIRAVAILGVIAFHVANRGGGGLGVTVFFVLSGFLITTLIVEEHDTYGTVELRSFYRRRVARLAPALVLALIGYMAITTVRYWETGNSRPVDYAAIGSVAALAQSRISSASSGIKRSRSGSAIPGRFRSRISSTSPGRRSSLFCSGKTEEARRLFWLVLRPCS